MRDSGASSKPSPERAESIPLLWWALALLPALLLFVRHWSFPPPYTTTDYAQYIMQAREVLQGRLFAETAYIFTPLSPIHGPPTYPPGFPMTLAVVFALFGESAAVLKLVMLLTLLVFLVLVGKYFAVRDGRLVAVSVVMMTAVALESGMATQSAMSDLGFCAISWGLILLVEGKERFDWKRVLLVAILGFAAIAYRAAGVVVIPAVGLYALLHIRLHGWERGWRLLMPVALWLAVLVGASVLLHRNASSALTGTFVLAKLVRHALHYKYALFGSLTYPFPWDGANDAFHAVGLAIAVIGVVVWLRKREARYSMLAMYTFGTAAMLALVWAMADRYIWPLFPVLAYCFLLGIRALTRLVRRASTLEWRTRVAAAVLMLVTLSATAVAAAKPRPVGFMDRPDVRDIFARVSRLGREENARVLFVNPRVLAWQTGVPSMGLFDATDSQMMAELERKEITHVIVGDVGLARHNSRLLREFLANHPAAFQAVYQNAGFTLYRFRAR